MQDNCQIEFRQGDERMAGFALYPRRRKNRKPISYSQFKKSDESHTTAKKYLICQGTERIKWCENYLSGKSHFRNTGTSSNSNNNLTGIS
jgi:hypothetical protein